jgi:hypothetical protein
LRLDRLDCARHHEGRLAVDTACVASARVLGLAAGILDEGLEQDSSGEVLLDDELEHVRFVHDRDLWVRVEEAADRLCPERE